MHDEQRKDTLLYSTYGIPCVGPAQRLEQENKADLAIIPVPGESLLQSLINRNQLLDIPTSLFCHEV